MEEIFGKSDVNKKIEQVTEYSKKYKKPMDLIFLSITTYSL